MAAGAIPTELGTKKISSLLRSYAVPGIIAMTATSLYNVVDRAFIGHIEEVGPLAISGLTVTFPLMNISAAFGTLVGVHIISDSARSLNNDIRRIYLFYSTFDVIYHIKKTSGKDTKFGVIFRDFIFRLPYSGMESLFRYRIHAICSHNIQNWIHLPLPL